MIDGTRQPLSAPPGPPATAALYLHVPFCDHRCAYCDFNAYAGLDRLIPAYMDALAREARLWSAMLAGARIVTIFFGGGTPSLAPLPLLERVLDAVREAFDVAADAEITLEANPGTVDDAYLRGLRVLGINRLSLGAQSFDDRELRALDRIHDAAAVLSASRAARAVGFENINLDLIFGIQGQDPTSWRRTLARALALQPEHLSLYALTVEEGTKLAQQVRNSLVPAPDPDLQAELYEIASEQLADAGYVQYEISNWSLPGRECRHNLVYWRNEPYLGLGAGAHSHLAGRRFAVVRAPAAYIARTHAAVGGLVAPGEPLARRFPEIAEEIADDPLTDASDTLILGLRLNAGVEIAAFAARYGRPPAALCGEALAELERWGLIEQTDGRLRLTARGRFLANEVFVRLLPAQLAAAGA